MRVANWVRRSGSPSFSIGARNRRLKLLRDPSRPGIRNANCDHSSPRLFSIGVPDRHSRWRVSSRHTAWVAFAAGLLIAWASSSTTMCHGSPAMSSMSRVSTV